MNRARIKRDLDRLAASDVDVARAVELVGYPEPRIRNPGFETFLSTIVSQQISTDAAAAIMGRVRALLPEMHAGELLGLPANALREAGLSQRKVEYATDLARAIHSGDFKPDDLADMDDADAIAAICNLRGFGAWSAEIYLMFCLQRADIFPAGDLALRIALQRLKGVDETLDEKQARALVESWSPCRSAGSLLLWHYYRGAPT